MEICRRKLWDKIGISKDTVWQHLKKLCRMGAVSHPPGKLYFASKGAWALLNPKTGYTSSKLDPAGNLYVGLLFSITQITNRYLALLQAVVDAPDISTAHDRAEFFLTAAGDESEMMGLARRVWRSKGGMPLESLIGKKLTFTFVKGQPPTGGVSVTGSTDKAT